MTRASAATQRRQMGLAADRLRHASRLYLHVRADHGHRRAVLQRLDVRRLSDDRLQPALVRQADGQRAGADRRSAPRCGSRWSPPPSPRCWASSPPSRWCASNSPASRPSSTLVILPALVPETILGVGLLVLIKAIDQPRTMLLLVLGHILLALPYVVLIVQARMVGISRVYEEAALSLGRLAAVVLPRDHPAAAHSGGRRRRAARLHHLLRQHLGQPVLASGRRRDDADPDPVDAARSRSARRSTRSAP